MSYIYLQEQGEESSVDNFKDIPAYVLLRLNLIQDEYCSNDSGTEYCHTFQSGMTSEPSMEIRGVEKLTLLPEAFLAKTFPQQERELASKVNALGYGERWSGFFLRWRR